jgi:hypothetical protein
MAVFRTTAKTLISRPYATMPHEHLTHIKWLDAAMGDAVRNWTVGRGGKGHLDIEDWCHRADQIQVFGFGSMGRGASSPTTPKIKNKARLVTAKPSYSSGTVLKGCQYPAKPRRGC